MTKPNRAFANMPKMPMWDIGGWQEGGFFDGNDVNNGNWPTDAAEAFAKTIRDRGIKGVRIVKKSIGSRNSKKRWTVMIPGNMVTAEGRSRSTRTIDDVIFPAVTEAKDQQIE